MAAVRPIRLTDDLPAVLMLQRETYTTNFPGFRYGPEFERLLARELHHAKQSRYQAMYVAELDGHVVGFAWVALWCAEFDAIQTQAVVKNVCVAPGARRQGIGRSLMEQLERWAEEHGARRLCLQVTASNAAAVRLYRSLGYEVERYEMAKPVGGAAGSSA